MHRIALLLNGKYKCLHNLVISDSDLKPIGNLNHVCGPPKLNNLFQLKIILRNSSSSCGRQADGMSRLEFAQMNVKIFLSPNLNLDIYHAASLASFSVIVNYFFKDVISIMK